MSLFEQPNFQEYASITYISVQNAQREVGMQLTALAEQIVASWILAPAFEGPSPAEPPSEPHPDGARVSQEIIERLPNLLVRIGETSGASFRSPERRNIVTSADLFHWLTERGSDELGFLRWPYPKD